MKIPKEALKFMGIANNVFSVADMGKTTYDVCKRNKPVSEIVKKASGPAVGFIVKRALGATGVVGMAASFVVGTALNMAIDYACDK